MSEKVPLILSSESGDKEEFRKMMTQTLGAVIDSCSDKSAFSGIDPYQLRKKILDLGFLPENGLGFEAVLSKVEADIMPNLLRTWSTMYMPHLHAPALTETIASELIIAAFNDSMDSWDQGPAATELEESMIHGLLELFGFRQHKDSAGNTVAPDGTFTSGGTQSNMSAIIAARDRFCGRVLGHDVKKYGLPSCFDKMRLYTSEVSHFSMDKTCHFMGLGYEAVRKIPVDSKCRVNTAAFEKMVEEDVRAGLIPFCAVATIGTTDYGSIDNVGEMRRVCDRFNIHLHADAAYGGAIIMSTKYRSRLGDLSVCDSVTVDFHKMFLLPISCSVVLFRDGSIQECFELHADYLNREEDEEEGYINLVGKSMQTTRRFDALKVFMAFQTRGRRGFEDMINTLAGNAEYFYGLISRDPLFLAPVEPELSSVVFAVKSGDEANKQIRKRLLAEGTVIGQTTMDGRVMLKFTLLNPNLAHKDIDVLVQHIKDIDRELNA